MAARYPGAGFYDYHKQFSAKAASYLKNHNWKLDWSKRDSQLYSNIFTNYKSNSCQHCHSVSHLSDFCPKILQDNNITYFGSASNHYSYKSSGTSDLHGKGEEICNNLNGNEGCFHSRCNNLHVCLECHGPHSRFQCTKDKESTPKIPSQTKNHQAPPPPATVKITESKSSTPIDINTLQEHLKSHPEKDFTNYLIMV